MTSGRLIAIAALGGVAGWALENALAALQKEPARWSHLFGKRPVPFLPVYAAGATGLAAAVPLLRGVPAPVRGALYAAGFSALEVGACALDRRAGEASWHYPNGPACFGGCVDLPHAAAWAALGLSAESVLK